MIVCLSLVAVGVYIVSHRDKDHDGPPPQSVPTHKTRKPPVDAQGRPLRPFEALSWWNTPVPASAPHNPYETEILNYLSTAPESRGGCLRLAGAQNNPWGQPVYWAQPGDPVFDVQGLPAGAPKEAHHMRIPIDAVPANNSDGTMSVFDLKHGYVMLLTDARHDAGANEWSASGATVTYLDSDGLDELTGKSDTLDNVGTHRGNNGATSFVRWDMVQDGEVRNVLKIASGPELSHRFVFPMTGSDGDDRSGDTQIPPEGLRLRIKPSVDLKNLSLHPQALVIAEAIQKYGVYLGDSGGSTALKLEDTTSEGRGQFWDVTSEDLCSLPFSPEYWDVLPEGYDPSGS